MTTRKSKRPGNELKPSVVEEWDFSDCPEDELELCCHYEYSRERDGVKAQVAKLRDPEHQPNRPYPGDAAYYQEQWFTKFFGLFNEFPDKPWLAISAADRYARVKQCARWDTPFLSVCPERLENDEGVYPYFPMDVGTFVVHSVHAVEVDWTASNDALKKAFDQWLTDNRPRYATHLDQTGRVSDRELLKYLGAYRLLRCAENQWEIAKGWAEKFGRGTDWTPLYSDERAYKRAKGQAKHLIEKGVALTPAASLIQKLELSKLAAVEKARAAVRISQMKRGEIRKLNQQKAEAALAEILKNFQREEGGA